MASTKKPYIVIKPSPDGKTFNVSCHGGNGEVVWQSTQGYVGIGHAKRRIRVIKRVTAQAEVVVIDNFGQKVPVA